MPTWTEEKKRLTQYARRVLGQQERYLYRQFGKGNITSYELQQYQYRLQDAVLTGEMSNLRKAYQEIKKEIKEKAKQKLKV